MDHKNGHISTNMQRQKLSIAVVEAAHEGPSHAALRRAVLYIKRPPKSKNRGGPPMEIQGGDRAQTQEVSLYIIYIYIHIYTYIYIRYVHRQHLLTHTRYESFLLSPGKEPPLSGR